MTEIEDFGELKKIVWNDKESRKLCDMSNEALVAWLWLISRRNYSVLTITGRRSYCRR